VRSCGRNLRPLGRGGRQKLALPLAENEFAHGTLHRQSYIRPGKIFTAHESLFTQVLGQLRPDKLDQVKETVIRIIQQGGTEP